MFDGPQGPLPSGMTAPTVPAEPAMTKTMGGASEAPCKGWDNNDEMTPGMSTPKN